MLFRWNPLQKSIESNHIDREDRPRLNLLYFLPAVPSRQESLLDLRDPGEVRHKYAFSACLFSFFWEVKDKEMTVRTHESLDD